MNPKPETALRTAASDSPCVKVCKLHPDGSHCVGCLRTATEIATWSSMDAAEREAVLVRIGQRRALQQPGRADG